MTGLQTLRPAMAVSRGLRAIMGVFGPMLTAALEGGRSTANMWRAYTEAYRQLGQDRPPATLGDMNAFRQGLGSYVRSMRAVDRAADADALTSEHWATPIGYAPSGAEPAVPSLVVYYQSLIDTEEGQVARWSSLSYHGTIPATVGEIRSDAVTTSQLQLDLSAMEEGGDSPTAGGNVVGLQSMYLVGRGL